MKMLCQGLWPAALAGLLCTAAYPASEPLTPILACRTVADPAARLTCFDRESARLLPAPAAAATTPTTPTTAAPSAPAPLSAPAPAPAPAAAVSAAPTAIPAPNAKENFGLSEGTVAKKEVDAGARPKELSSIDAHIVAVSVAGAGLTTFTLDNGQVWRQLSAEGDLLAKSGDSVTVSRGVFRSYWLQTKSGRGCKVTRIA
jgi:hypothetical protein